MIRPGGSSGNSQLRVVPSSFKQRRPLIPALTEGSGEGKVPGVRTEQVVAQPGNPAGGRGTRRGNKVHEHACTLEHNNQANRVRRIVTGHR